MDGQTDQFWGARDELTIDNRLLLKGDRVCIPPELYQRMLSELHEGTKALKRCNTSPERRYIGKAWMQTSQSMKNTA